MLIQLLWMSNGLLRIRRYRIAATPLYPVPDAMRAASAITHADALFCVSEEAAGPVMMGWLAPVVLLPPAFLDLDEEAQCGIACHELLHVRRGDWMVTLIEELAGALLWFNPGAWLLLSEARLAREQLVDAESVRLTASREPYIDALMSMARAHTWSDLVPAPSFLRRSHLTQRMQSLLSDTPASTAHVIGSYGSFVLILGCSAWAAAAAFPIYGQPRVEIVHTASTQQPVVSAMAPPSAPAVMTWNAQPVAPRREQASAPFTLPPITDPHEPIGPAAEVVSTPMERSSALSLLAQSPAARSAPCSGNAAVSVCHIVSGRGQCSGDGSRRIDGNLDKRAAMALDGEPGRSFTYPASLSRRTPGRSAHFCNTDAGAHAAE